MAEAIAAALPTGGMLLSVDGAIGHAEDFAACRGDRSHLPAVPRPDRRTTAFIFYTSGTTGLPKGVVITHRTSEHRIVWLSTQAGLRHGTHNRTSGWCRSATPSASTGRFLVTLAYNGTFYTMSAFNPAAANDLIERHKINYLFSVPTLYQAMVSAPNYMPEQRWRRSSSCSMAAPRSCRRCSTGSIASGPQPCATSTARPNHVRALPSRSGRAAVTFRPGYYSRVRVVRLGGTENDLVKPGEAGELIVDASADTFFSGYLNRPDATAEKLRTAGISPAMFASFARTATWTSSAASTT